MPSQLLKYILYLLLGFVVIDFFTGLLLDKARDTAPDGRYYKARYSLDQGKEEIVILGSSRGEMNYAPYILEDSLGKMCWNASRGGQSLPYFRAIQEGLLNRYTPEVVILNLETFILETEPEYEHLGFLRPFASKHPEIRPVLHKIGKYEWFNLYSRLYAYNSSFYYLLRPFLKKGLDGQVTDKGWKPKDGEFSYPIKPTLDTFIVERPLNVEATEMFDTLVQRFKSRNCVLILVVSPNYGEATISSPSLTYYKEVAKKYNLAFFNYASDINYISNPDYFIDYQHLNRQGAELFTREIASKVKAYLKTVRKQEAMKNYQTSTVE